MKMGEGNRQYERRWSLPIVSILLLVIAVLIYFWGWLIVVWVVLTFGGVSLGVYIHGRIKMGEGSRGRMIPGEKCLRCGAQLTVIDDSFPEIDFFTCPECHSHYARKPGQDLHDGWMMPLSLVLYPVIFHKDPVPAAKAVAREIYTQQNISIETVCEHIYDELSHRRQKVSEILDFAHPDEERLREFLKNVAAELRDLQCEQSE